MQPFLVGIAGGTGVGKTTLARTLCEREPERYAVMRVDDYYHERSDVPAHDGIINWERPEAIDFDRLYEALRQLKTGQTITVDTRMWVYGEGQQTISQPISFDVAPKPVVILEGFLALHDPRIRELFDMSIYLDMPIEASLERRRQDQSKYSDDAYFRDILIPAHQEFVVPTKAYADVVIEVDGKTAEEVYGEARAIIEENLTT